MAKSARSSVKKALRTVRRDKVSAGWQAEADAKRLANLNACMNAAPLPLDQLALAQKAEADERKLAAAHVSDTGGAAPMVTDQHNSGKGNGKHAKGVVKRQGKKVSVLWGKNQFHKKERKGKGRKATN